MSSTFGRTGAVVAAASDYDASQVDNDSGVAGSTVADALDALDTGLASSSEAGNVYMAVAVADLSQTISDPPTQTEVQDISTKIDDLLAKLRTAGSLSS
ncbi:MAG: hypothetical protein H8E94_03045 [Alphaproteobacteria bacterium]|nr:hypothetical protein [Alphaproteobacteria bacterium]